LTSRLLDQGAGDMDADAIAEGLEGLGAEVSASSLRDMAVVDLRSLNDPGYLEPALGIRATILQAPTFPPDAMERERGRMLTALQAEEQSPGDIASKAFYRAVYSDHAYASHPLGTAESLEGLTRDQVESFHQEYYVARNAV